MKKAFTTPLLPSILTLLFFPLATFCLIFFAIFLLVFISQFLWLISLAYAEIFFKGVFISSPLLKSIFFEAGFSMELYVTLVQLFLLPNYFPISIFFDSSILFCFLSNLVTSLSPVIHSFCLLSEFLPHLFIQLSSHIPPLPLSLL